MTLSFRENVPKSREMKAILRRKSDLLRSDLDSIKRTINRLDKPCLFYIHLIIRLSQNVCLYSILNVEEIKYFRSLVRGMPIFVVKYSHLLLYYLRIAISKREYILVRSRYNRMIFLSYSDNRM